MHGSGGARVPARAPGGRRLQREEIPFRRDSRGFAGIGPSISPGRIIAAAKAAAPAMDWPRGLVDVLDRLLAFSRGEDWRPGRRPIVWPSNQVLAEVWGLGRTQVKARIRQLARAGLIVMAESPNGQRWGRRDDRGRIVEAYGFDLSPLAGRYREFVEAAKRLKDERLRCGRARRRITIGIRHLAQLRDLAADAGVLPAVAASFEAWTEEALDEAGRGRAAASADDALSAAVAIDDLVKTAEARLGAVLSGGVAGGTPDLSTGAAADAHPDSAMGDSDPMGPPERPPITPTTELPDIRDVQRSQVRRSGAVVARPAGGRSAEASNEAEVRRGRGRDGSAAMMDSLAPSGRGDRISLGEILRLAPSLAEHLASGEAVTWSSVVDAADRLRATLGVSRPAWIEACTRLGREGAAVLVGIIAAKRHWLDATDPGYPRIAGAYFRGLLDRQAKGQLFVGRTLWGMRAAREERLRARGGDAGAAS